MNWQRSHRQDRTVLPLVDRHYSRQSPGADRFGRPCRSAVFKAERHGVVVAVWLTSWPLACYVDHSWFPGSWECSLFRNESATRSSDLIRAALRATWQVFGPPPPEGMITFVDPVHVPGTFRRSPAGTVLDWGYSYERAGFEPVGWTKSGKRVLHIAPEAIEPPAVRQLALALAA